MEKTLLLCLLIALFISCTEENKTENYERVITNVNLVDVSNNKVVENSFVAIKNDSIARIGKMEDFNEDISGKILDGKGNFLMPGLWDMHVHFRGGDSLIAENRSLLPLYLAHGVTTVRDAGGDMSWSVLEWEKQIANKQLIGPDIYTSGPKLDGENPSWAGSISVSTEADVEMALDSLEAMNADFVKIYDGSVTKEMYYEIIKQAEKRNLKVTGHMPMAADVTEAVKFGLDGTEHLYYIMKAASSKKDSIEKVKSGYSMIIPLAQTYNDSLAKIVFNELAEEDFYATPTLYIGSVLKELADADHSEDEVLEFIGPGIQETYQGRIISAKRAKESGSSMRDYTENVFKEMIRPMYDSGIKILAGSDAGPFNSFVYPGESLHAELEELVDAGLTPRQALETSVINGPEFFGIEGGHGNIKEGMPADLIILEANPLEDIKNTRNIKFVIKNGKVHTPGELLESLN